MSAGAAAEAGAGRRLHHQGCGWSCLSGSVARQAEGPVQCSAVQRSEHCVPACGASSAKHQHSGSRLLPAAAAPRTACQARYSSSQSGSSGTTTGSRSSTHTPNSLPLAGPAIAAAACRCKSARYEISGGAWWSTSRQRWRQGGVAAAAQPRAASGGRPIAVAPNLHPTHAGAEGC